MPNLKKPVQFDHFRPYYLARDAHGQSQEHVYDLKSLLQHVKDHPFSAVVSRVMRKFALVSGRNLLQGAG